MSVQHPFWYGQVLSVFKAQSCTLWIMAPEMLRSSWGIPQEWSLNHCTQLPPGGISTVYTQPRQTEAGNNDKTCPSQKFTAALWEDAGLMLMLQADGSSTSHPFGSCLPNVGMGPALDSRNLYSCGCLLPGLARRKHGQQSPSLEWKRLISCRFCKEWKEAF